MKEASLYSMTTLARYSYLLTILHNSPFLYSIFRKKVIIAVFIRSANMAPIIGTIRKGLTV